MNALSTTVLPEFTDDEQLPVGTACGRQPDLENLYMEAVNLTCETVPVDRTLGSLCRPFPLAKPRTRPVDNEFNVTDYPRAR
jgi:hypothetical protein